jgi:prepilin-type N-terminal cleavage/methylation domain-containing protein
MNKKYKAFTLIELLVVIAIIGILSGFIFVSMSGATDAAKDAKRKADLATIQRAVLEYAAEHDNVFPYTATETACSIGSGGCATLESNLLPYLPNPPRDPNGTFYTYTYSATGPKFILKSTLSNTYIYQYDSTSGFSIVSYVSTCVSGGGLTCTETIDGAYVVNKYTGVGTTTWQTPIGVTSVRYLVIGGGGGGSAGGNYGGGGGAGQFLTASGFAVNGSLTVTVGVGGSSATAGSQSIFSSVIASGGAAGSGTTGGISGNGRTGGTGNNTNPVGGGGGGGSAANGSNVTTNLIGGNGGTGTASDIILSGVNIFYAGGGGGAGSSPGGAPGSGAAGGGNGGIQSGGNNGSSATANTGSGGGGAVNAVGGNGGSGIVIIRYLHP